MPLKVRRLPHGRCRDRLKAYGNGWTPWDLSWKEFVKGSALPVPAELAAQAGQE